jgi:hypothetical protein
LVPAFTGLAISVSQASWSFVSSATLSGIWLASRLTHRQARTRFTTRVKPESLLKAFSHQAGSCRRANVTTDIALAANHTLLGQ